MSYNPNIPNIGDFTAISQKQMLANFKSINSTFLIDHVALTSVDNVGQHKALTLIAQAADPVTSATQSAIYNKLVSGAPQLFFRPSSNQTAIQLSNSNLNTLSTGATADVQSSFLAGPFTIYVGYVLSCPDNQIVVLPGSTTLLYVGLSTYIHSKKDLSVDIAAAINIVGNQFTIHYNSTFPSFTPAPHIYYMAIGQ